MPDTPRALGFRMPAEWEPHEATWIAWPHNRDDWPGRFAPIPWVYAEIVRKLTRVEQVRILVEERCRRSKPRAAYCARPAPTWKRLSSFTRRPIASWTRDYCPLFVKDRHGASGADQLALQRLGQVRRLYDTMPPSQRYWAQRLKLPCLGA